MPRRHSIKPREIEGDPKFNDLKIAKFINYLMEGGKKDLARRLVYDAFDIAKKRVESADPTKPIEPTKLFEQALANVEPRVEVKSRRIGGATYQVPVEVPERRRFKLASSWMIDIARKMKGSKGISGNLAQVFSDSYNNMGTAVKKREDTHKMAEANKAFAHFKW